MSTNIGPDIERAAGGDPASNAYLSSDTTAEVDDQGRERATTAVPDSSITSPIDDEGRGASSNDDGFDIPLRLLLRPGSNYRTPEQTRAGWDRFWGSSYTSDQVDTARKRVESYTDLVRNTATFRADIQTLLGELSKDSDGIFNVVDITVDQEGISTEHRSSRARELVDVLETLLERNRDVAASPSTESWTYFVVEDLTPEVVGLLGGFLDLSPRFFLTHMAGGGLGKANQDFYDGNIVHPHTRPQEQVTLSQSWDTEGHAEWNRHTWPRMVSLGEWRTAKFSEAAGRIAPSCDNVYVRSGFWNSTALSASTFEEAMTKRFRIHADTFIARIFRTVSAIRPNDDIHCIQERMTVLRTTSATNIVGIILVDAEPLRVRGDSCALKAGLNGWPDSFTTIKNVLKHIRTAGLNARGLSDPSQDPFSVLKETEAALLAETTRLWSTVYQFLGQSLDDMDPSMMSGIPEPNQIAEWQRLFASWRSSIPQMIMDLEATKGRSSELRSVTKSPSSVFYDRLVSSTFPQLISQYTVLLGRVDRTSQALMSTLSIMESQNAIQQGREIQKLTELAFIFIPVSSVAAYFGMEVQDWDGPEKPGLRSFWIIAGVLVGSVYAIRILLLAYSIHGQKFRHICSRPAENFRRAISRDFVSSVPGRAQRPRAISFLLYLFQGLIPQTIATLFLGYFPIVAIWIFRRPSWPRAIPFSVTLFWGWLFGLPQAFLQILISGRINNVPGLWQIWGIISAAHLLAIFIFTLLYPALMINFGDLPGTASWSPVARIVPVTVLTVTVILVPLCHAVYKRHRR